ncbi:MAG: hypothetical protein KDK08_29650 [Rhizobiaceae bacterium]|nr:hypothetical protein [Rhizobiaceae bacterium]
MSDMFEPLHQALKNGEVVFIDDAFFTFCDKGDHVTSTNFFSLNDTATVELADRLEQIANGRRIKISLSMKEDYAPEFRVLEARGYKRTTTSKKGLTQHWEKNHA